MNENLQSNFNIKYSGTKKKHGKIHRMREKGKDGEKETDEKNVGIEVGAGKEKQIIDRERG